jgi:serum/glucocorticoid-regulated kinase 2
VAGSSRNPCICTRHICKDVSAQVIPKALITINPYSDVSRNSEISIQCYLRTEQPKGGGDGLADDMGNDIFMGGIKFIPDFDNMGSQDQWYDLTGSAGGKIQIGVAYKPSSVCHIFVIISRSSDLQSVQGQPLMIDDFELITLIGRGSFGKVGICLYCTCNAIADICLLGVSSSKT